MGPSCDGGGSPSKSAEMAAFFATKPDFLVTDVDGTLLAPGASAGALEGGGVWRVVQRPQACVQAA